MDLSGEADVILLVREYEPAKIVAFFCRNMATCRCLSAADNNHGEFMTGKKNKPETLSVKKDQYPAQNSTPIKESERMSSDHNPYVLYRLNRAKQEGRK